MPIRGGENIHCVEVETAPCDHPDVRDAALVGLPRARRAGRGQQGGGAAPSAAIEVQP
jgi:acyl-CoA synthetase (AMP-forming)/AMP-acid ligase II